MDHWYFTTERLLWPWCIFSRFFFNISGHNHSNHSKSLIQFRYIKTIEFSFLCFYFFTIYCFLSKHRSRVLIKISQFWLKLLQWIRLNNVDYQTQKHWFYRKVKISNLANIHINELFTHTNNFMIPVIFVFSFHGTYFKKNYKSWSTTI